MFFIQIKFLFKKELSKIWLEGKNIEKAKEIKARVFHGKGLYQARTLKQCLPW